MTTEHSANKHTFPYPNPLNEGDLLTIHAQKKDIIVKVFDLKGFELMMKSFQNNEQEWVELKLNIKNGMYYIEVQGKDLKYADLIQIK